MKRYLVFAGYAYYPSGGWDDFVGAHETLEEARAAAVRGDWWQIVDLVSMSVVESWEADWS